MRLVFDLDLAGVRAAYRARDAARFVRLGEQLALDLGLEALDRYLERFAERDREQLVEVVVKQLYEAVTSAHGYGFEHVVRQGIRTCTCLVARGEDRVVVGLQPSFPRTAFPDPGWRFRTWHAEPARNAAAVAGWARDPARDADAVAFAIVTPLPLSHSRSVLAEARGRDLLAEVRANPGADHPRLVYADWLLERGDVRGELIQLQCELATNQLRDSRRPALRARERELLDSLGAVMVGDVARVAESYVIRRGLVDSVAIRATALAEHGDALLDAHPIRHARVVVDNPRTFAQLGSLRVLGRIPRLEISGQIRARAKSRTVQPAALARTRVFANTEQLAFDGLIAAEADWRTLLAALEAPRLRAIGFDGIDLGHSGLAQLASTSAQPLESVRLGYVGLRRSAEAESLLGALASRSGLRALTLASLPFDRQTTDRVLADIAARAGALTELAITRTEATDATLEMLGGLIADRRLDRLELGGNASTLSGLAALIRAPGLANVAALAIDPPFTHDRELELLADALLEISGPTRVSWPWAARLGPVRGRRVLDRVDLVCERRDGSLDLVKFE